MCNTFKEIKDSLVPKKRKRSTRDISPAASNSSSGERSASSSNPEIVFDDLDDDLYLLPKDKIPKLLSAVKDTIESSKDVSARPGVSKHSKQRAGLLSFRAHGGPDFGQQDWKFTWHHC